MVKKGMSQMYSCHNLGHALWQGTSQRSHAYIFVKSIEYYVDTLYTDVLYFCLTLIVVKG